MLCPSLPRLSSILLTGQLAGAHSGVVWWFKYLTVDHLFFCALVVSWSPICGDESVRPLAPPRTTEADLLDGVRTSESCLQEMIENPAVTILKCESASSGELMACVCLEQHDASTAYIGMLTVYPEAQAQGIGKQVLAAAENYAHKHLKCKKTIMTVISVRHELIGYYERRGYRWNGEKKPFPMDDPRFGLPKCHLDFIVMEKELCVEA